MAPNIINNLRKGQSIDPLIERTRALFGKCHGVGTNGGLRRSSRTKAVGPSSGGAHLSTVSGLNVAKSGVFGGSCALRNNPTIASTLGRGTITRVLKLSPADPSMRRVVGLAGPSRVLRGRHDEVRALLSTLRTHGKALTATTIIANLSTVKSIFTPTALMFTTMAKTMNLQGFLRAIREAKKFEGTLHSVRSNLESAMHRVKELTAGERAQK